MMNALQNMTIKIQAGLDVLIRKRKPEIPKKTNTFILLSLLVPGLFLITILSGHATNAAIWLAFIIYLGGSGMYQWIHGYIADRHIILNLEHVAPELIPQGPLARLIPERMKDAVMRVLPDPLSPYSPYARMDYHLRKNAHGYQFLERDVLAEIAANQWEQRERKQLDEEVSSLASFDDIKEEHKHDILAGWRRKTHFEIVVGMVRDEILNNTSYKQEEIDLYFERWFVRSVSEAVKDEVIAGA